MGCPRLTPRDELALGLKHFGEDGGNYGGAYADLVRVPFAEHVDAGAGRSPAFNPG